MKRTIYIFITLALLFTLPACSNPDEGKIVVPEGMKNPLALYDDNGEIVVSLGMTQDEVEAKLGTHTKIESGVNYVYANESVDEGRIRGITVTYNSNGRAFSIGLSTPKYCDYLGLAVGQLKRSATRHKYARGNEPVIADSDCIYVGFDKQLKPQMHHNSISELTKNSAYIERIKIDGDYIQYVDLERNIADLTETIPPYEVSPAVQKDQMALYDAQGNKIVGLSDKISMLEEKWGAGEKKVYDENFNIISYPEKKVIILYASGLGLVRRIINRNPEFYDYAGVTIGTPRADVEVRHEFLDSDDNVAVIDYGSALGKELKFIRLELRDFNHRTNEWSLYRDGKYDVKVTKEKYLKENIVCFERMVFSDDDTVKKITLSHDSSDKFLSEARMKWFDTSYDEHSIIQ